MKNLLFTVVLFFIAIVTYAQSESDTTITDLSHTGNNKLKKDDFNINEFFTDIWQKTPSQPDNLKTKAINRGYNVYFMMDNPLGKSNISIAYGIGVSVHNMYSNCMPVDVLDTALKPIGKTEFRAIPENIKYENNKITLFYGDIPLELRFRTKKTPNNFKFAIGFKVGYLLQSHIKYEGDRLDNIKGTIKYKTYDIPNIEKLHYSVTARLGFGRYSISGAYSLTTLFKGDKGPEMFPISVGIAVTPF